jgi:hypothetical protein
MLLRTGMSALRRRYQDVPWQDGLFFCVLERLLTMPAY